jgi:hypothetical protein
MKKLMRLLAAVLALTMLCEMLPLAAFAQSDIGQAVTAAVQGIEEENSLSGSCGENATWEFDYSTLTISGTGAMEDYSFYDKAPWYEYMYYIKKVVIQKGITSIGKNAFWDCEYLTGVTIPEGVESIGDYAFLSCKRLRRITIPDGVTHIGRNAFDNCARLVDITLPESATSIGEGAFEGCDAIENIALPSGMTSIAAHTFSGCRALKNIVIPDGVTSIGNSAFSYCGLTDIMIPENVEYIGEWAFRGCEKLESIVIPDGITSIGDYTFCECSSLTDITLPESVESIGKHAFEKSAITNITFSDNVTSIGESAFAQCNQLTDVYYGGSEEKWKEIDISISNDPLINATIHYNYSGTEEKPSKEFEFKKDNPRFLNNYESFFDFIDKTQHFFHGELVKKQWKWFGHADDVIPEAYYTHISPDAYEQLLSGCSERVRKYVESVRIRYWNGSCYGMAVAAMLNYYAPDRVKLSELAPAANAIYGLPAPANSEKVENFINYYYLMQCLPTLDDFKAERSELYSASLSTAYNEIVAKLQKNVPILAAIYKENGGHAIVLLDIINKDANSCEIRVYDPNEPEEQTMTLYKQLTEWSSIKISYGEYNRMGYHICADELQYLDIRNYFEPNRDSFAFKTDYDEPEIIFDSNVDVSGKYGDSYFDTSKKEYSRNVQIHRILSDTDDYSLMQMFFPQSDENAELELSLTDGNDVNVLLEDTLLTISTDGPVKLTYDESARTVDVSADDPTAVSLLMTQNTVNDSWPWHSWAVDTTGTTTLHAELDSEGLHLTGDGLTGAKYATENADTEQTSKGTINVQPDETGKTSVTIINKNDGDTDDTEVKGEDKAEETTYTVTVNGGTASPAKAKEGETVTITAEKTDTFQNWTVVAGGITLENENLPTTTFTMGKENVVITANYSSGGNITPPSPGEPGQSPSDDGGAGIVLAIGAAATVAAGIGAIALMPVKVEGKVELADHTALPGAKIALLQNGKVVAQTTTDADGKFALKVKRGSYELTAAYTDANGQLMHKTASFKAPAKNLTVTF